MDKLNEILLKFLLNFTNYNTPTFAASVLPETCGVVFEMLMDVFLVNP